jgi:hypothetical protein
MKATKHETFRSGKASFDKDFGDFLIANSKDHWKVSQCTFFRSHDGMKSWAFCSFQRSL